MLFNPERETIDDCAAYPSVSGLSSKGLSLPQSLDTARYGLLLSSPRQTANTHLDVASLHSLLGRLRDDGDGEPSRSRTTPTLAHCPSPRRRRPEHAAVTPGCHCSRDSWKLLLFADPVTCRNLKLAVSACAWSMGALSPQVRVRSPPSFTTAMERCLGLHLPHGSGIVSRGVLHRVALPAPRELPAQRLHPPFLCARTRLGSRGTMISRLLSGKPSR